MKVYKFRLYGGFVSRVVAKGGKVREGMTDRAVASNIKDNAKAGLD